MWTSEQIDKAERSEAAFAIDDNENGQALYDALEAELGEDRVEDLFGFVQDRQKAEPVAAAPKATPPEPAETYDLLPFNIYDPKLQTTVPATNYMIDQHCRPHGTGGRYRKRGPLTHQHTWVKRKGREPAFFNGYWLSLGSRQRKVTDRSLAMSRLHAERDRRLR